MIIDIPHTLNCDPLLSSLTFHYIKPYVFTPLNIPICFPSRSVSHPFWIELCVCIHLMLARLNLIKVLTDLSPLVWLSRANIRFCFHSFSFNLEFYILEHVDHYVLYMLLNPLSISLFSILNILSQCFFFFLSFDESILVEISTFYSSFFRPHF